MSTSKLQIAVGNLLDKAFPQFRIRENYRPDWLISPNLTKLELDFFIEELNVAFEIQGIQHFEFVPHFHGDINGFQKRKSYDEEKKNLCYGAGVELFEIVTLMDAIITIKNLESKHSLEKPGEEIVCPITSNRKEAAKREKKYKRDYKNDPVSIYVGMGLVAAKAFEKEIDLKADEMQKFYKKLKHFCQRGGKQEKREFIFSFQFLDYNEQQVLLEELKALQIKVPQ